ncbi:MAG: pyruvate kinase, partial [bacterium]|nr:pyruvate kinase [bacterium]
MRNTKIVATLGPATDSEQAIRKLVETGVNVFRFNASHGTQAEHGRRIEKARAITRELGTEAGILLDLQGPKIRLGLFPDGGCRLDGGAEFVLTTEDVPGTANRASISYSRFAGDVQPGDRVLINDGMVEIRVLSVNGAE